MTLDKEVINKWKEQFFQEIIFPIIIFSTNDYLAVSGLDEYYYDVDINLYYVNENCELIDSRGVKYNFKRINEYQWVPYKQIGQDDFQTIKTKIAPLLYMPEHMKVIESTSSLSELMELILK